MSGDWLNLHLIFHCFSPFNCCLGVFFGLMKGITPKMCMLCSVLINSVILNLSCDWILS